MTHNNRYPIPHSLPAEESVIGAAFLSTSALDEIVGVGLLPDHFLSPRFRETYRAMLRLRSRGDGIDSITVANELQRADQLDASGGFDELARLQNCAPSLSLATDHARIVRKSAEHRAEIRIAAELTEAAYRQDSDGVERVRHRLLTRSMVGYCPPSVEGVWQRILEGTSGLPVPTILGRSDGHALIHEGSAVMMIGPAGAGKSWLACLAAFSGPMRGRRVAWVDLDNMGQEQLVRRLATMGLQSSSVTSETLQYFDSGHFDSLEVLLSSVEAVDPDMVVIDCLLGLLSMDGLDENSNGDVRSVLQRLRDSVNRRRARTLLVVDHIGHEAGRARGASAKAQWADQVMEVISRKPFGVDLIGKAQIASRKDRHGYFPDGALMADFHLDATSDLPAPLSHLGKRVKMSLEHPGTARSSDQSVEDLIVSAVDRQGGTMSWSECRSADALKRIPGSKLIAAREGLVASGVIKESVGKRRAITLTLAREVEP